MVYESLPGFQASELADNDSKTRVLQSIKEGQPPEATTELMGVHPKSSSEWKPFFPLGSILDERRVEPPAGGPAEHQMLLSTGQDSGLRKVRVVSRSDGSTSWMDGEWLLAVPLEKKGPEGGTLASDFRLESIWGSEAVRAGFKCEKLKDYEEAEARLRESREVAFFEPDYLRFSTGITPNDPLFESQHYLENLGRPNRILDADIDALEAWAVTKGSRSVLVAVLDGGLDVRHPEFASNLLENSRELPRNQIDEDGNGLVDDWKGWDFTLNRPLRTTDDHGNAVTSLIGAVGNNETGITGVCPEVSLLPLRVMNQDGVGLTSWAVAALNYAVAQGAKITNHSYGSRDRSTVEQVSIDAAAAAGVLMVAAVGNDKANLDRHPFYPASYASANILSVAASDGFDRPASFTSKGARSVDLFAPGTNIVSLKINEVYEARSGTSLSAPLVTGTAALLLSANPGWSASDLRSVILSTVDLKPTLKPHSVTGGRLNAGRALNASRGPLLQTRLVNIHDGRVRGTSGDRDAVAEPGELIGLEIEIRNGGSQPAKGLSSHVELVEPTAGITLVRAAQTWADLSVNAAVSNPRTPFLLSIAADARPGTIELRITHTTSDGQSWPSSMMVEVLPSSTLAGRVTTPTGVPLSGATVSYQGPTAGTVRTARDGHYNLTLPHGRYEIRAASPGRVNAAPRLEVLPPHQTQVDFTLGQPQIRVTPAALTATLPEQGSQTRALRVTNPGDSPLQVTIEQQSTRMSVSRNLAWLPTFAALGRDGLDVWRNWQPTPEWRAAGRLGPWAPLPLVEGFETGTGGFVRETMKDYVLRYLWVARFGRAPAGFSASGNGSLFYRDGGNGANNFAFRRVAYGSRPRYFGVSVRRSHAFSRPLSVSLVYFPVKDPRERPEPIFGLAPFNNPVQLITLSLPPVERGFAIGNAGMPVPDAWCRLEAVNIDWDKNTYDYRMDGMLIKQGISFRNAPRYMFSYTDGVMISSEETESDSWIDDLVLSEEPTPWAQHPSQITVPPGGSVDLPVQISAASLRPGSYGCRLDLRSNAPARPLVQVPVSLTVRGRTNVAPVAENRTIIFTEDQPAEFTIPAKDAQGDALILEQDTLSAGKIEVLTPDDGIPAHHYWKRAEYHLRYTPPPDSWGKDGSLTLTYRLRDYELSSATGVITFSGLPTQDAPLATTDVFETRAGGPTQSLDVLANDRDVDDDSLQVISVTPARIGSVALSADGRSILYTPAATMSDVDVFDYTISDGQGGASTAQVRIGVPLIGASWTTQGGDMGRSYSSPVVLGAAMLQQAWTASTLAFATEPVIAGGRVFVASTNSTGSSRTLQVQAHDLKNGTILWSRTWQGVRGFSALSWWQGRIYMSLHEVLRSPETCQFICLDGMDGRTLWQNQHGNRGSYVQTAAIVASPLIADGVVVFQRPDQFYEPPPNNWTQPAFPGTVWLRFDALTGVAFDGAGITSLTPNIEMGVALVGNRMTIQPAADWGKPRLLQGMDLHTGSATWSYPLPEAWRPVICASGGGCLVLRSAQGSVGLMNANSPSSILTTTQTTGGVSITADRLQILQSSNWNQPAQLRDFLPSSGQLLGSTPVPMGANSIIQLADVSLVWRQTDIFTPPTPTDLAIVEHLAPARKLRQTIRLSGKIAVGEGILTTADSGRLITFIPGSSGRPTATPQTLAGVENEALTITLTGTSPEPGTLRHIIATLPTHGKLYQTEDGSTAASEISSGPTLVTNAQGRVILVPEPDYNGSLTFTFQVQNEVALSTPADVSVNLASRPSRPRAVPDRWTLATGGVLSSFRPEANDFNTDGGAVTLVSFTSPSRGILSRNADGSFRYEAEAGEEYVTTFTYVLQNGAGLNSTGTVTLATDGPSTRLWSMTGGHGSRLSYYPGQLGSRPFSTVWTSAEVAQPLIGGGGRVYALSPKINNTAPRTLSAFSATSGAVLWTHTVKPECILACDETSVYVTSLGENSNIQTQVFAISGATGLLRWSLALPVSANVDAVIAPPHLVVFNNIFMNSSPNSAIGALHFIDLQSGSTTRVVTNVMVAGSHSHSLFNPRLSAAGGTVYVNDGWLYGFDAATGLSQGWSSRLSNSGHVRVFPNRLLFAANFAASQDGTATLTDLRGVQQWTGATYSEPWSSAVGACAPDMIVLGERAAGSSHPFALQTGNGARLTLPGALGVRGTQSIGLPTLLSEDLWMGHRGSYSRSTGVKLQDLDVAPTMAMDGKLFGVGTGNRLVCMAPATASENNPPIAQEQSLELTSAVDREITLSGTDPEGASLEFLITTLPTSGTLHQRAPDGTAGAVITHVSSLVQDADHRLIYRPGANGFVSASFRFAVVDSVSQRAEATITLQAPSLPPVHPPVARDDLLAVSGSLPIRLHPLANDTRDTNTTLQIISHTQGAHGSVMADGSVLIYTPTGVQAVNDRFSYTVEDGNRQQSSADVHILTEPGAGGWNEPGANSCRTRFVPLSLRGLRFEQRWRNTDPNSRHQVRFADGNGRLMAYTGEEGALDAATGFRLWSLASESRMIRGEFVFGSSSSLPHRIQSRSLGNGTLVSEYPIPKEPWLFCGTPSGLAFVADAFNPSLMLADGTGRPAITISMPQIAAITQAEGKVMLLGNNANVYLRAIRASDGQSLWMKPLEDFGFTGTPDLRISGGSIILLSDRTMVLDADSGTIRWMVPGTSYRSVAVANGQVYGLVITQQGFGTSAVARIEARDLENGRLLRTYQAAGLPTQFGNDNSDSIAVTQDTLVVNLNDSFYVRGTTYFIDLETDTVRQTLSARSGFILSRDGLFAKNEGYLPVPENAPVNLPPSLPTLSVNGFEDVPLRIQLSGADPEGDAVQARIDTLPAVGKLFQVNDDGSMGASISETLTRIPGPRPEVYYQGPAEVSGADLAAIEFTLADGKSTPVTGRVRISLEAINDPPLAHADEFDVEAGELLLPVHVLRNDLDPEGSVLTITAVGAATHGRVWLTPAGALAYEAPRMNPGVRDTFSYTVTDAGGQSSEALVTLFITERRKPEWLAPGGGSARSGWSNAWLMQDGVPLTQLWTKPPGSVLPSITPVVAEGKLYVGGPMKIAEAEQVNTAIAFDTTTGTAIWYSDPPGGADRRVGALSWHDGHLLLLARDGFNPQSKLYCLDARVGDTLWKIAPVGLGDVAFASSEIGPLISRGDGIASLRPDNGLETRSFPGVGGFSVIDDKVFLAKSQEVQVLSWENPVRVVETIPGINLETRASVTDTLPPVLSRDHCVVRRENQISVINIHEGRVSLQMQGTFGGLPSVAGREIFVVEGEAQNLSAYDLGSGRRLRIHASGRPNQYAWSSAQPVITDTLVISSPPNSTGATGEIFLWDRATGSLVQTLTGGGNFAVAGDKLFQVRSDGGLIAWGSPAPVTFSPAPGTHTGAVQVRLTSPLSSAVIHYSLDGSAPNTQSPSVASGEEITLSVNAELRAIAVNNTFASSPNASVGRYRFITTTPSPPMPTLASVLEVTLDSDGDGQSDVAELLAGTDRFDPKDILQLVHAIPTQDGSILRVSWTSENSRDYLIEISTDLKNWHHEVGPLPGTGDIMSREISKPSFATSFFARVRALP